MSKQKELHELVKEQGFKSSGGSIGYATADFDNGYGASAVRQKKLDVNGNHVWEVLQIDAANSQFMTSSISGIGFHKYLDPQKALDAFKRLAALPDNPALEESE